VHDRGASISFVYGGSLNEERWNSDWNDWPCSWLGISRIFALGLVIVLYSSCRPAFAISTCASLSDAFLHHLIPSFILDTGTVYVFMDSDIVLGCSCPDTPLTRLVRCLNNHSHRRSVGLHNCLIYPKSYCSHHHASRVQPTSATSGKSEREEDNNNNNNNNNANEAAPS
jgi:hypothetical protein